MHLEPGTDLYLSIEDATSYLRPIVSGKDMEQWIGMSDEDKELAIFLATVALNQLPWRGFPLDENQPLLWPRLIKKQVVQLPEEVKRAVAVEALILGTSAASGDQLNALRNAGVLSYSIDDYSVSFDKDAEPTVLDKHLKSSLAKQLVSPWVARGTGKGVYPIK